MREACLYCNASLSILLPDAPAVPYALCTMKTKPSGSISPFTFSNPVMKLCSLAKRIFCGPLVHVFSPNRFNHHHHHLLSGEPQMEEQTDSIHFASPLSSPLLSSPPIFFRSNLAAPTAKKNAGLTASSLSLSLTQLSLRDGPLCMRNC